MKLYVDLETLQLIEGPGFRTPPSAIRFKRGDATTLEVAFLTYGLTPAFIGNPATLEIQFGIKARGRYDLGYLVHEAGWTMPDPESASPAYRCAPDFNTVEINSALGVGSPTGSELAEIVVMGEITWSDGGLPTSTRTFQVIIENDVNRGTEGVPTDADPPYPAPDAIALAASVVRHDAAQSLTDGQKNLARSNIGLGTAATENATAFATVSQGREVDTKLYKPVNIFIPKKSMGSDQTWPLAAKYTYVDIAAPSQHSVKTTTGYAKTIRWDGTYGPVCGAGVPGNAFTLTHGTAMVTPYTTYTPKTVTIFPCLANGTISGAITYLDLYNTNIIDLDVSNCTQLTYLSCGVNSLVRLDVSRNTALETLKCWSNLLLALDVSANTALVELDCSSNANLPVLDVSNNTALVSLKCDYTSIAVLDLTHNILLQTLSAGSTKIASFDLSNNTALAAADVSSNMSLRSLAITNNTALLELSCSSCSFLAQLTLANCPNLKRLVCSMCDLHTLTVTNFALLEYLDCSTNFLGTLTIGNNSKLSYLTANANLLNSAAVDAVFNAVDPTAPGSSYTLGFKFVNVAQTVPAPPTIASLTAQNLLYNAGFTLTYDAA